MATETERQSILATANRRYATKAFDPSRQVSEEDLRTILEAGRLAPSSFGYEPWKFLVVRDEELRAELAPLSVGAGAVLTGGAELVIILFKRGVVHDSPYAAHIVTDMLGADYDPGSFSIARSRKQRSMLISGWGSTARTSPGMRPWRRISQRFFPSCVG